MFNLIKKELFQNNYNLKYLFTKLCCNLFILINPKLKGKSK